MVFFKEKAKAHCSFLKKAPGRHLKRRILPAIWSIILRLHQFDVIALVVGQEVVSSGRGITRLWRLR